MLDAVTQLLEGFQWPLAAEAVEALAQAGVVLVLAVLAAIVFFIAKRVLLRVVSAAVLKTTTDWDDRLLSHRVFFWLAHLAPGFLLYVLAPGALAGADALAVAIRGGAQIYLLAVGVLAVDGLINAALEIYDTYPVSRQTPLKGVAQVAKILLYAAAAIVMISTLLGRSPLVLFSSLGILASVLMLVFKDAILGFVAGIQLATNQMLSKGDWLEMPAYGADGDVIDIALTTVKVQNWDKTITTIPTYALITESFKNWRGMSEAGGRRIKRAVYIDMASIRLCTPEMIERYSQIRHIAEYVERKQGELAEWNDQHGIDDTSIVNGRRMTNVGTFRAYLVAYLRSHPSVHQEMTLLVRQLHPTPLGLPIEIYCFASDIEWAKYEAIQADIFDHVLAVAPEFDLRIFQSPGGADLDRLRRQEPDSR
ncbi:MAG: mechanosensitive ion channel [Acidobacteria bacterium]|nr:mechanosensitive ion channel [Acidobacteriota bacterium]